MTSVSQLAQQFSRRGPEGFHLPDYQGPWKKLGRDGYWLFDEPHRSKWTWRTLAESLAKINRYDGATELPFSVAQHSCLGHDQAPPDLRLHFLLHDAPEMVIGDKTQPVKDAEMVRIRRIRQHYHGAIHGLSAPRLAMLEEMLDEIEKVFPKLDEEVLGAIYARLPFRQSIPDSKQKRAIKEIDVRMLATEIRDQLGPAPQGLNYNLDGYAAYPTPIRPWPWTKAADEFLKRLSIYMEV